MLRPSRPVFPHMGWSCVKCRRAFAWCQYQHGCPYCPSPPTPEPAPKPLPQPVRKISKG